MPTIHPPQYTKITHPQTRAVESCYTFRIMMDDSEERISFLVEEPSTLVSSMIVSCLEEHRHWWEGFLRLFLERSAKFFSKSYTVQQLYPIITHAFSTSATVFCPSTICLSPKSIQIRGGTFCVFWEHECEPLVITIPVGTDALPVDPTPLPPPQEWDTELEIKVSPQPSTDRIDHTALSVPVEVSDLEEFPLHDIPLTSTENPAQLHDRQRAKEARLKAKLAIYRAQAEMNHYYDKYGTELSDSDPDVDSESESDSDSDFASSRK